jgi:hypothetical protein
VHTGISGCTLATAIAPDRSLHTNTSKYAIPKKVPIGTNQKRCFQEISFVCVGFSIRPKKYKNGNAIANLSVQNANDGICFKEGFAKVCMSANMSCTKVNAKCVVHVDGVSYSFLSLVFISPLFIIIRAFPQTLKIAVLFVFSRASLLSLSNPVVVFFFFFFATTTTKTLRLSVSLSLSLSRGGSDT